MPFTFIDLFAGIGGFHAAVKPLGGTCVMVSEIDGLCINTYKKNFDTDPQHPLDVRGDIRKIDPKSIPAFDVLCAGFPCQSFSKAGKRKGFKDKTRGDLFSYIIKILEVHTECKFLILENVRNLADNDKFWSVIQEQLSTLNYFITQNPIVLSPTDFGIPQNRDRVFIIGVRKDIANETVSKRGMIEKSDLGLEKFYKGCPLGTALSILDPNPDPSLKVSSDDEEVLEAWDHFKQHILKKRIDAPIWMEYFGDKDADDKAFYARVKYDEMPDWKQRIVKANRDFYTSHSSRVNSWIKNYHMENRNKIYRKFEWNCKDDCASLKEGIIQIRHSGVRVKRPSFYPALVAINNTPIVWSEDLGAFRHLSVKEAAKLQSFPDDYQFLGTENEQFKQLGNSVNVGIVRMVAQGLFGLEKGK